MYEEQIKALFEGQNVPDDFVAKFTSRFDSLIESVREASEAKAKDSLNERQTKFEEFLKEKEEIQTRKHIDENLAPKVLKVLDQATEEYLKENKVAIESSIKNSFAESLIEGIAKTVKPYNVKLPEGSEDKVAELESRIAESNKRNDELNEQIFSLNKQITEAKRTEIESKVFEGLTDVQKEKLHSVTESSVTFKTEEQYTNVVKNLREEYFPKPKNGEGLGRIDEQQKPETKTESSESWEDSLASMFS